MITLRAMEPDDIDVIYRWENDPSIWVYSAAHQPFSRHALQQFIDESSQSDIYTSRQLRLMAVSDTNTSNEADATNNKPIVGSVDLYDFEPLHRRSAIGILVDPLWRRNGFGSAMLEAIELFAREHLDIHQLYCDIEANNNVSIKLFEHAGYQRCAEMKQWLFNASQWSDAYRYQKIFN